MIQVTVKEPKRRVVYVNGVYDESVGTIKVTLSLSAGSHKFETLRRDATVPGGKLVDFRGTVTEVPNKTAVDVILEPVLPPEPIGF